jgi:hypothetical protein
MRERLECRSRWEVQLEGTVQSFKSKEKLCRLGNFGTVEVDDGFTKQRIVDDQAKRQEGCPSVGDVRGTSC